jgi:uncharacterized cofD-like protein
MKITVLGGGTGNYTLLSGLKHLENIELSAVVSTADDGGSSGILRDELGVLPPGDIRQCFAALADEGGAGDEPLLLRRFLNLRVEGAGSLRGHTYGNIMLAGLQSLLGDPLRAIRAAHQLLRVHGRIIPVSAVSGNLYAELEDGTIVEGEHSIDEAKEGRSAISRCFLDPDVEANPEAVEAILDADALVFAPGDLYTSLVPVLLVRGIADAIRTTKARRIYVVNLVTKRGQTDGYGATRFVDTVSRFLPGTQLQHILLNNGAIAPELLLRYEKAGEHPVFDDLSADDPRVVRRDFVSRHPVPRVPGDVLQRSLIRHDPNRLAEVILEVLTNSSAQAPSTFRP